MFCWCDRYVTDAFFCFFYSHNSFISLLVFCFFFCISARLCVRLLPLSSFISSYMVLDSRRTYAQTQTNVCVYAMWPCVPFLCLIWRFFLARPGKRTTFTMHSFMSAQEQKPINCNLCIRWYFPLAYFRAHSRTRAHSAARPPPLHRRHSV